MEQEQEKGRPAPSQSHVRLSEFIQGMLIGVVMTLAIVRVLGT